MARISWDQAGQRYYEAGVDRGVLYVGSDAGVPWSGLISVDEKPSGGKSIAYYIDGEKYLNISEDEEYAATIEAFTFPVEFLPCNGMLGADTGLYVMHQPRQPFCMSYRTMIGSDSADEAGYLIHMIHNALADPSDRSNATINDSPTPSSFSWDISTCAPQLSGFKSSAHLVIDTRTAHPGAVSDVEDILYGTDTTSARIPGLPELITIFDNNALFVVVDNGDGTWTATAADSLGAIQMLDAATFQIDWPSAEFVDSTTYTLKSL